MRFLVLIVLLVASSAHAAPCLSTLDESRYTFDRGKEDIAASGKRFDEDLRKCNRELAAGYTEYIRYQIHDQEAKSFAAHGGSVKLAYGVAWALVVLGAVAMYLRQRKLEAAIGELEAKLRARS
jgi:hypothetical protein